MPIAFAVHSNVPVVSQTKTGETLGVPLLVPITILLFRIRIPLKFLGAFMVLEFAKITLPFVSNLNNVAPMLIAVPIYKLPLASTTLLQSKDVELLIRIDIGITVLQSNIPDGLYFNATIACG